MIWQVALSHQILLHIPLYQTILLASLSFLTVFSTLLVQHRYVEPSKKLSLKRAVKRYPFGSISRIQRWGLPTTTYFDGKCVRSVCENKVYILTEVIENLDRLQKETTSESSGSGLIYRCLGIKCINYSLATASAVLLRRGINVLVHTSTRVSLTPLALQRWGS